jgi:hypothetical protein
LNLVAQLSSSYGYEKRPGRKHVWARLPSGQSDTTERRRSQLPEPRSPEIQRD